MTLRCKPGDLAVIVRGGNSGKFVTVEEVSPVYGAGWWLIKSLGSPLTGRAEDGTQGTTQRGSIRDSFLRPLRDQDGTDEVLRIAQRTA